MNKLEGVRCDLCKRRKTCSWYRKYKVNCIGCYYYEETFEHLDDLEEDEEEE